ncbi:hypothetical protein BH09PAT2_BH09PAT2_03700 [soil metagenome]
MQKLVFVANLENELTNDYTRIPLLGKIAIYNFILERYIPSYIAITSQSQLRWV